MSKTFTRALFGAGLAFFLHGTAGAQITLLKDYTNNRSAAIGTYQGINFREAGFSALFPIPNTGGTEFWTCSDRGVNVDDANANPAACRPSYDKMFVFPDYAPKIHRLRIGGDSIQILSTLTIKRPSGTAARGVLLPTGRGSTAAEVASTDTVMDCGNFAAKTTPKDTFSIDSEGLVVDKDGFFWLSEENGPSIWKLNANGVLVARYTPYAGFAGAQSVDRPIDTAFKYRRNNRGFEDIAITPGGKIYVAIQSPMNYPTAAVGASSRVHRILELNPATGATRMLAYLNDGTVGAAGLNQIRTLDWKLSDMAAINDSTFLIIEAAARGTSDFKRIYKINISNATAIHSGIYDTATVEGMIDSAGLAARGIVPVQKTLFMDLLANGWPAALDKAEGLAILNDSTIALCNDNDYGQSAPLANGIPTATTNLSHLIVYRLQDSNKLQHYGAPVTVPTSVAAVPTISEARVFPNPTGGDAVVEMNLLQEERLTVSVLNAEGKQMLPAGSETLPAGNHRIRLATAGLADGLYFVQLSGLRQTVRLKLVVLH